MRGRLAGAVVALATLVVVVAISVALWARDDGGERLGLDEPGPTAESDGDSGDDSDDPPGTDPDDAEHAGDEAVAGGGLAAEDGAGDADEAGGGEDDPPAPPELEAHLRALLDADTIQAVDNLTVLVTDDDGREIVSLRPDLAVTPASTTKLVTAAAAYRMLGPDYRYVTRLHATAEPEDGALDGDLVIVGSGDPALASPVYMEQLYPARPHTSLAELADAVERAGIKAVTGSVLGDPRLFEDEPVAEGWADRYFASLDASHASGLTVDAGRSLLERDDTLLAEIADDPAVRVAEVLTELLEERDIEVRGEPRNGQLPSGAEELGRVRSPRLAELLAHVVQRSDNHMADGIFRTLGALSGPGTWEASDGAVRKALAGTEVDSPEALLFDGSGLSRENRLSARMLVDIDRTMTEEHGEDWQRLLAVAGESGTLRNRLSGTPAEGRTAGKTGALRDARALAAQVDAPDGSRYHFAVVGGPLDGPGIQATRKLMDEIALLLASNTPACFPHETDDDGRCP